MYPPRIENIFYYNLDKKNIVKPIVLEFPKAFFFIFLRQKEDKKQITKISCEMYSTVVVSFGNGILLLKYIIHTGLPEHTLFYLGSLYFVLWSPTFCLLMFCPFLTFWKFIICSQLTSSWGRMKFRKNEGGGRGTITIML